jgi:hypothetical protein
VFRQSSNQNLDIHNEILVKLTAVSLSSSEHYQKHDLPGHDYLNFNFSLAATGTGQTSVLGAPVT